jgi:hypothetical protein
MMVDNDRDPTHLVNPISDALSDMLNRRAARPKDVYRLAVIVQGMMESLDDPEALKTIRGELRALLNDLAQTMYGE